MNTIRTLMLLLCVLPCADALAYLYSVPVQVSSPTVPLTNNTVRVALDSINVPNFQWANNCDDIEVVDDAGTAIDFFLESCDTAAQRLVIWVEVPSIPVAPAQTQLNVRYADPAASSLSDASATFDNVGIKYHTQPFTGGAPGPQNLTDALAAFDFLNVSANTQYGCVTLNSGNVRNRDVFSAGSNLGYHTQSIFSVPSSGTYEFSMGTDYGYGGEVNIDGQVIESDWTTDLWWAYNYNHPDVMTGSVYLEAGFHSFWTLGFEGCCDGRSGIRFRPAGGTWKTFSVADSGLTMLAPDCPLADVDIQTTNIQESSELMLSKTVSDVTPNIGDTITFYLTVTTTGPFDATDVLVEDVLPAGFGSVANISNSGVINGSNQINWTVPSVPIGTPVVLSFDATVL